MRLKKKVRMGKSTEGRAKRTRNDGNFMEAFVDSVEKVHSNESF